MQISSYQNPFLRAKRYLYRVKMVYEGVDCYLPSSEFYHDDIYAFFVFCYHVKDWLIGDHRLKLDKQTVEKFINNNFELMLCADVCNGTKHFIQTAGRARTGQQPVVYASSISVTVYPQEANISPSGSQYMCSFGIETSSGIIDVLTLAEKCISLWSEFLDCNDIFITERDSFI
ncbi:hypothetical protein [Plesiomonas shigelloides]|uniref:hypothetical protein n=1 Tax=Plesiomonas shigelloides TaxID=703 RepID=UPI0012E05B69|nr:hypothetical protein [Plesiomonas shigelloides]